MDLDQPLKNLDGTELKDAKLADILTNLLGSMKGENGLESMKIYRLAQRTLPGGKVDFTEEEIALIKRALDQNVPQYFAVVVGQLQELFEV